MSDMLHYFLSVLGGYLLGSIPFGLVLTRAAGLGDIRTIGSGNIGATNVLRTGRKDLALATLLLDSFKAGLATLLFTSVFNPNIGMIAGAAAFFGHCYPVWLGFKGGKGVATYAGLLIFATPPGLIVGAPTWLAMFAITRISSLAALTAATIIPFGAFALGESLFGSLVLGVLTLLIYWTHRANIQRLLRGDEPRFGADKNKA